MDNPAYRLHNLLEKAYERSNSIGRTSFKEIWSEVFEIDEENNADLLLSYNLLLDLYFKTREYIESNEFLNDDLSIKFLEKIKSALSYVNFEGDMDVFRKHMDKEVLTALKYMSRQISMVYNIKENLVNQDEIDQLIQEINILSDNIADSDLPNDAKILLTKNLSLIRESLYAYKISGADGINKALDQSLGSLIRNNHILSAEAENKNVTGMFQVMDRINTLLSTGVAIKDLIGPLTHLLIK